MLTETPAEVLREARHFIAGLASVDLRTACLIDKATDQPIRETIDELCAPHIEEMEQLLTRIDAALVGQRWHKAREGDCISCDAYRVGGVQHHPSHDASTRCESGKRSHCTCDTCF